MLYQKILGDKVLGNPKEEMQFLEKNRDNWNSSHFIYQRANKILKSSELGDIVYDTETY